MLEKEIILKEQLAARCLFQCSPARKIASQRCWIIEGLPVIQEPSATGFCDSTRAEAGSSLVLNFARVRLHWLREHLVTRIPVRNQNRPDKFGV
jgi:hypothetical protein